MPCDSSVIASLGRRGGLGSVMGVALTLCAFYSFNVSRDAFNCIGGSAHAGILFATTAPVAHSSHDLTHIGWRPPAVGYNTVARGHGGATGSAITRYWGVVRKARSSSEPRQARQPSPAQWLGANAARNLATCCAWSWPCCATALQHATRQTQPPTVNHSGAAAADSGAET